jgi:hypothetical protein
MNDRMLKRMILEAIQEVLAESKLSTSVLEKVENMDDPEEDAALCRALKKEHQKHRESAQGGSTVLPQKPHKGSRWEKEDTESYERDSKRDREEHQRGRDERKLERRYIAARNKVCAD